MVVAPPGVREKKASVPAGYRRAGAAGVAEAGAGRRGKLTCRPASRISRKLARPLAARQVNSVAAGRRRRRARARTAAGPYTAGRTGTHTRAGSRRATVATPRTRRGDTRRRIQDAALSLFVEQGYEKTSLREIAAQLDVTKAALYYHFKTKEDILISIFEDRTRPLDELIAWGREQPRNQETKRELLRRYSAALHDAAPVFRFVQENQATVRDLSIGGNVKERMFALFELVKEPDASLTDQVRSVSALFTIHAGIFALKDIEGDPEDKRAAVLEVALDLIAAADAGRSLKRSQ
ncbi:TetR family transcriptional regulator [Streptomyces sp. SID5475]|nr:TetR family transcriptional regulator [Streptomyces sp. SID5475]